MRACSLPIRSHTLAFFRTNTTAAPATAMAFRRLVLNVGVRPTVRRCASKASRGVTLRHRPLGATGNTVASRVARAPVQWQLRALSSTAASAARIAVRPCRVTSMVRRSARYNAPVVTVVVSACPAARRSFHSSKTKKKSRSIADFIPVEKLSTASVDELYHYSHVALAASFPVALVLSPTFLNIPVDFFLGAVLPFHAHVGMQNVLDDYVPPEHRSNAKLVLVMVTILVAVGLLKVNLCGPGITESIKSLWRRPPAKKAIEN